MTGKQLKRERIRRQLTQEEFARLIGTSQGRLSKYEAAGSSRIPAQFSTIRRITAILAPSDTAVQE